MRLSRSSARTATKLRKQDSCRLLLVLYAQGLSVFGSSDDEDAPELQETPRQSGAKVRQSTPRRPPEASFVMLEKASGERGAHTLATLQRKVASLSNLQKRYQQDGKLFHLSIEDETNIERDEDDEEVVQDVIRDEDMTLGLVAQVSPPPFPLPSMYGKVEANEIQIRPPLTPAATSPKSALSLMTPDIIIRTLSDAGGVTPRSRSSSLTAPAPPPRLQHRSPSRSADLDKFTIDYDRLVGPEVQTSSAASTASRLSTYTPSSTAETSVRSFAASGYKTPVPQTPHADSPILSYLKTGAPTLGSSPDLADLSSDSAIAEAETTPVKSLGLQRPRIPTRATTTPIPTANADVRFWIVAHDYDPREITFNSEGNMVGASLAVLVEKMTPHDGPVDPSYWASFFFTFRLFTTPAKLVEATIARYDLKPPPTTTFGERERAVWNERKVVPVRLRIYNFLKAWLETHWRTETDDMVLQSLHDFATGAALRTLPAMAPRLLDVISRRMFASSTESPKPFMSKRFSSIEGLRSVAQAGILHPPAVPSGLPPTPIVSKSLNSMLQKHSINIPITEFDALELARQLTIIESKLFCAVNPEDLLQTGKKTIPSLRALSTLSNQITGWVADGVLNEEDAKKRAALLKFYIKIADVSDSAFRNLFSEVDGSLTRNA